MEVVKLIQQNEDHAQTNIETNVYQFFTILRGYIILYLLVSFTNDALVSALV